MNLIKMSILSITMLLYSCKSNTKNEVFVDNNSEKKSKQTPFYWEAANLYFLLVDRFCNGDTTNDLNYNRTAETATLRGFEGGDIKGITQKINSGYFTELGINAIWLTPIVEQIHGAVDEGTGATYGYHGYWAKDWTAIDANFGTKEDLKTLVETAHQNGIRIVLDAVINHTGPVTALDAAWPIKWVRQQPQCDYTNYENTTSCTLVKNLPDIYTNSNEAVELPNFLIEKWKKEGRYEQEIQELVAFFQRTGYPKAPRFYIIKWLTDYVREFGIDGYRCDTVKHTEPEVWKEFKKECDYAFQTWKQNNANKVLDNTPFYLVGEVYNYEVQSDRSFNFGDKKVDYYNYGFNSLINFGLRNSKNQTYEELFASYSQLQHGEYQNYGFLNYISSHDDGHPYDLDRTKTKESANKLLLCPGTSQVYYGDEVARKLKVVNAVGDVNLRSNFPWSDLENQTTKDIRNHWQKLGQFRRNHPAIGAGKHQKLQDTPYLFSRTFQKETFKDIVIVGLDYPAGKKEISVKNIFLDGTKLKDYYSGATTVVTNGIAVFDSAYDTVLLEQNN